MPTSTWIRESDEAFDPIEALSVHAWLTGRVPARRIAPVAEAVRFHRKSVFALSTAEQTRLLAALNKLVTLNQTEQSSPGVFTRRWGKFPDIHREVRGAIHGTIFDWFNNPVTPPSGGPPRPRSAQVPTPVPPATDPSWNPLMQFLPWHRMFLIAFEQELQRIDPSVTLPYWDWTVDRSLPSWVRSFLPTIDTSTLSPPRSLTITRSAASAGTSGPSASPRDFDNLPSASDVAGINAQTDYPQFTTELELTHNRAHVWVGGDSGTMAFLGTSAADFCFFLHHAQIDRIWALWQQSRLAAAATGLAGAGAVGGVLGMISGAIIGAGTAASTILQAMHPTPSLTMSWPAAVPRPVAAGVTLTTCGQVLSTTDLEYDYV